MLYCRLGFFPQHASLPIPASSRLGFGLTVILASVPHLVFFSYRFVFVCFVTRGVEEIGEEKLCWLA